MQRLQNKASRIILQRKRTGDSLKILNWMNLENRRSMHACILVFKCINNYFAHILINGCRN